MNTYTGSTGGCQCGTRIYHATDDGMDILSIKAGSLDDSTSLQPTCHLWTKRKQVWLRVNPDHDTCYETEPPSDEELIRQWTAAGT